MVYPPPKKILVIDDDQSVGQLLLRFLSEKGYAVWVATHPIRGIELVKREYPHLVLLDIRLPLLNGYQVLRRIKELCPNLAVIMITAFFNEIGDGDKFFQAGAVDFITKPFDLGYLETSVRVNSVLSG